MDDKENTFKKNEPIRLLTLPRKKGKRKGGCFGPKLNWNSSHLWHSQNAAEIGVQNEIREDFFWDSLKGAEHKKRGASPIWRSRLR